MNEIFIFSKKTSFPPLFLSLFLSPSISFSLSSTISIYLFKNRPLNNYQFVIISFFLFFSPFIFLSMLYSNYLSFSLSRSFFLSIYLSICLSFFISIYFFFLSIYLSRCNYLFIHHFLSHSHVLALPLTFSPFLSLFPTISIYLSKYFRKIERRRKRELQIDR